MGKARASGEQVRTPVEVWVEPENVLRETEARTLWLAPGCSKPAADAVLAQNSLTLAVCFGADVTANL